MGGFLEAASAIISRAESTVELNSQNLVNMTSTGFKRRFATFSQQLANGSTELSSTLSVDFSPGKETQTSNPADLAISGQGFFMLRSDGGTLYGRDGAFHRDGDGRLVTSAGLAVQAADGGDIVIPDAAFEVASDGTITAAGAPVARLAVVDFADPSVLAAASGGLFSAPEHAAQPVALPVIHQGALESSNVSNGVEMIAMMEGLRRAESGQRLVQVYDDLMGRVLTTLGSGS